MKQVKIALGDEWVPAVVLNGNATWTHYLLVDIHRICGKTVEATGAWSLELDRFADIVFFGDATCCEFPRVGA